MEKKITLYTGQKKLFDKLSDDKLVLIFRNILKELDSQEIEPISDPVADMLYTVLSSEIVPIDGRSISSRINGMKKKKKAKCDLASDGIFSEKDETENTSPNCKNIIKEEKINKGNNTQEDISINIDNLPEYTGDYTSTKEEKEEKDKEENSKKEESEKEFETFWNAYKKKVGRPKCERLWAALSKEKKRACLEYIPRYIAAQPDKQYRKNPETFLRNECWNDEIITRGVRNESPMEVGVIMQKEDMDYSSNITKGW